MTLKLPRQRQYCSDAFNNVKVTIFLCILTIRKYISRNSCALQSLPVSAGLHIASSEFLPNQVKQLFKEQSRPFNSLNIANELVRNVAEHLHKLSVTKCHWKKFSAMLSVILSPFNCTSHR